MSEKRKRQLMYLAWALFSMYCAVMLWLLFGQRLGGHTAGTYWEQLRWNINLIPFQTILEFVDTVNRSSNSYLVRHAFINLAGNVGMFIPLGVFLPLLWRRLRSFGSFFFCTAASVAVVEVIQFFTLLGSCDIDDLLLNLIGASAGYLLFHISRLVFRRYCK